MTMSVFRALALLLAGAMTVAVLAQAAQQAPRVQRPRPRPEPQRNNVPRFCSSPGAATC